MKDLLNHRWGIYSVHWRHGYCEYMRQWEIDEPCHCHPFPSLIELSKGGIEVWCRA